MMFKDLVEFCCETQSHFQNFEEGRIFKEIIGGRDIWKLLLWEWVYSLLGSVLINHFFLQNSFKCKLNCIIFLCFSDFFYFHIVYFNSLNFIFYYFTFLVFLSYFFSRKLLFVDLFIIALIFFTNLLIF